MVDPRSRFLPMKTAGTHHFIERTYREGGAYQWVREAVTNAREAGATRIDFGVEWQAVDNLGVYRRTIADNGRGMTAEELVEFFNTFGGGGKPIGGVHENFGVGAKTSLLPWNRYGLVVISWVEGEPAMIWVHQDLESEEFGLKVFEAEDEGSDDISLEAVVAPFLDEKHGCDWAAVRPDWITDHGTVLVLLGNDPEANTVLGDPTRDETDIKGISTYLNRRFWKIPEVELYVDELRTADRTKWPRSEGEAHGVAPKVGYDRRTNSRRILGAHHYITYPVESFKKGGLSAEGEVALNDRTVVQWYLWEGERPAVQSYAAIGGYIAALYNNELYDQTTHAATYRSFGVSEGSVRQRLWLVATPPALDDAGKHGVYPRTDRNALLLKGGPSAGAPLPMTDWGAEFSDLMPGEILAAIRAARGAESESTGDNSWRDRLKERFGHLWRLTRLRLQKSGDRRVSPSEPGTVSTPRRVRKPSRVVSERKGGGAGGLSGAVNTGSQPGPAPARESRVAGGIPMYRRVHAGDIESGMLASWQPHDPEYPEGVVLLNVDHPVLEAQIERWRAMYPDHHAEAVGDEVIRTYGEVIVAKVAHSEQLKGILPTVVIEDKLRSTEALTMALLGLVAEEAVLATRIGGKFGRKRIA